jgi:hypothetical protein
MATASPSIEQAFCLSSKKVFTVFKKGVIFGSGGELEEWRFERQGGGGQGWGARQPERAKGSALCDAICGGPTQDLKACSL